jgi:hypothetical protein
MYRALSRFERNSKDKDYIDVEVIDNTKKKKNERTAEDVGSDSSSAPGFLGLAQRTAQTAVRGLTKLFGRDEETLRRKERTAKLDSEIDRAFQNSGVLGGLMGKVMKTVGGMVINNIADAARDIEEVRMQVEELIENDPACKASLGSGIQVYPPMSTSSSSMSVNGRVQKTIILLMPVQGSAGSGQVQVASSGGKDAISIDEVVLQLSSGRVINVPTRRRAGKGTIIDV